MKKVVLAIDSFKGCLSSIEADKTAEQGIKIVCPYCEVISLADSFFTSRAKDCKLSLIHF